MNRINRLVKISAFVLLIASVQTPGYASPHHSHGQIANAVEQFLDEKTSQFSRKKITVQPLDRRLRLPHCDTPLETSLLPGRRVIGRVSVGVRCQGNQPWSIYTSSRVELFENVVTLKTAVEKGTEITPAHLTLKMIDISKLRNGFFKKPEDAIGKRTKKPLSEGLPLNNRLLLTQLLVKKGRPVTILAKNKIISVRMAGKALSNGSRGDTIKIRNQTSGTVIHAKVIGENVVSINL